MRSGQEGVHELVEALNLASFPGSLLKKERAWDRGYTESQLICYELLSYPCL